MPSAQIASKTGPVELYYEDTGRGFPLVWCHEFGGDYRSWEYQVRYFSRRYRVVTWNYRGYPPSDVPKDADAYSVDILVEDLRGLLQHLGITQGPRGRALAWAAAWHSTSASAIPRCARASSSPAPAAAR